jgi:DNA polymerase-3 subunit gamma/tau
VSYRVFARKYRPNTFSEVVGQEHITRTLQNAIRQDRLAQAYLFVGPRGIGKTSTARILAKALNCQEGPTAEPCGKCPSCLEIAEGNSLDVLEIDGASNNGVDNIRDLRDNVQYTPSRGPYKIYLIDEVHMLSAGAFNALLKTLEEPPPHVKFLFATTEAQKLPATITSRCQRFDLRRIPDEKIARHLLFIAESEKITLSEDAAAAIARGADGGLRDAESMLDQLVAFCGETITAADVLEVFGFTARETISELATALLAADLPGALRIVGEQDAQGKDLGRLLGDLIEYWRDLLVARASQSGPPELLGQANQTSREKLLELLEHFAECEGRLRWATDKRMQADVAMIKAVHLLEQASLSDVLETIAELRDGKPAPAIPPKDRPAPPATARATPAPATPQASAPAPTVPAPSPLKPSSPSSPTPTSRPIPPSEESKTEPAPAPSAASSKLPAHEAWARVSQSLIEQNKMRFSWLEAGQFQTENDGKLIVEFSASFRACAESIVWEDPQKLLDAELTKALGRAVRFHPEFLDRLAPPEEVASPSPSVPAPPAEPGPPPTPTTAPAPSATPASTDDSEAALAAFKDDPLIQKALEVFEGKLLQPTKS